MDSIDRALYEDVSEAKPCYTESRFDEYIEKSRALLANSAISRYHSIKTDLLLSSAPKNWKGPNGQWVEME